MNKSDINQLESSCNPSNVNEKSNTEQFLAIDYSRYHAASSRWTIQSLATKNSPLSKNQHSHGAIAPQLPSNNDLLMPSTPIEQQSEDCLKLNIYRSQLSEHAKADNEKLRPVMVWTHGGGFTIGASSLYDGSNLAAATNCIVITLNYRLGALGFLRLKDITNNEITATGNEGLEDQILALRWIQQNINQYGGDKNNITLFGESAGAMSIACLLAMPKAKGLFHKTIMQSGAGHTFNTVEKANELAREFLVSAEALGFDILQRESVQQAKQLKQLTTSQVLSIQAHLVARPDIYRKFGILPFKPVVGDVDLPLPPYDAIKQGCAINIPMISGINTDEWTLFAAMMKQNITDENILNHWLTSLMGSDRVESTKTLMSKQCRQRNIEPSLQNVLSETLTEFWFTEPSYRLLNAQLSAGGDVYSYKLGRQTVIPSLRCTHIADIGLVFNNLSSAFHGEEPRVAELVADIQNYWGNFAHYGMPSQDNNKWPKLTDNSAQFMFFAHNESYVESFSAEKSAFWSTITDQKLASF